MIKKKKKKMLKIGIFTWRFILILLILPCLIVDAVGIIPMLILISMDKDNSPTPLLQHLVELW